MLQPIYHLKGAMAFSGSRVALPWRIRFWGTFLTRVVIEQQADPAERCRK